MNYRFRRPYNYSTRCSVDVVRTTRHKGLRDRNSHKPSKAGRRRVNNKCLATVRRRAEMTDSYTAVRFETFARRSAIGVVFFVIFFLLFCFRFLYSVARTREARMCVARKNRTRDGGGKRRFSYRRAGENGRENVSTSIRRLTCTHCDACKCARDRIARGKPNTSLFSYIRLGPNSMKTALLFVVRGK